MKETLALLKICIAAAQDKKADNIVVIDLHRDGSAPADYFVVCSAFSDVQARAIAQGITRATLHEGIRRPKTEGEQQAEWILLDYFDVVVHIFVEQAPTFYKLEKMWTTYDQYAVQDSGSLVLKEEYSAREEQTEHLQGATLLELLREEDDAQKVEKQSSTKKSAVKKSAVKKSAVKKTATKKSSTEKKTATTTLTTTAVEKKLTAKKTAAKKSVPKTVAIKNAVTKKTTTKKSDTTK